MTEPVLGIDLGTTNSAVAVLEGGDPAVLQNRNGEPTTPSVVRFGDEWESSQLPHVGESALNKATSNPDRTIESVKREIGSNWAVDIDSHTFTAEEISHFILRRLREDASEALGVNAASLTEAIITVPAYFTEPQRQATRDAATMAGFQNVSLLNEPSAAAMAYGYDSESNGAIVVFDLGGGTFDVSVLEVSGNGFVVQATGGDRTLGGDDWDAALARWVASQFEQEHGVDPTEKQDEESAVEYRMRMKRLYEQVRRTKHQICSTGQAADLSIPMFMSVGGAPTTLDVRVTPTRFREETTSLLEGTTDPVLDALSEAGLRPEQVDEVVLAGGATRMPQVRDHVEDLFGISPSTDTNPDEAVAMGAAIHAGAEDLMYKEVTPLTLGVELDSGLFDPLIERNTMLPATATKRYTTVSDTQDTVQINVYQGERDVASENRQLRTVYLSGLAPLGEGRVQIEVTFHVDKRGLLTVEAEDMTPGHDGPDIAVEIDDTANLTEDEIQAHLEHANRHAGQDRQRRALIEAQQAAHSRLATTEELLDSYGEQLQPETVDTLTEAMERLHDLANGGTDVPGEIEQATERVADLHGEAETSIDPSGSRHAPPEASPEAGGTGASTPESERSDIDPNSDISGDKSPVSGAEGTYDDGPSNQSTADWGADARTEGQGSPTEGAIQGPSTTAQQSDATSGSDKQPSESGEIETEPLDLDDGVDEMGGPAGSETPSSPEPDPSDEGTEAADSELSGRAVEESSPETEHATAQDMAESGSASEYTGEAPTFADDGDTDKLDLSPTATTHASEEASEATSESIDGDSNSSDESGADDLGAASAATKTEDVKEGIDVGSSTDGADDQSTTATDHSIGEVSGSDSEQDSTDDSVSYGVEDVMGAPATPSLDSALPDEDAESEPQSPEQEGGTTLDSPSASPVEVDVGSGATGDATESSPGTDRSSREGKEGGETAEAETDNNRREGAENAELGGGWDESAASEPVIDNESEAEAGGESQSNTDDAGETDETDGDSSDGFEEWT